MKDQGIDFSQDDDYLVDPEEYGSDNDKGFSYQALAMRALGKCIEAGAIELKPGYFNTKIDRNGNPIKVYIEDTRKRFIESVETAEMILICYFDSHATKVITKLRAELEERFKQLCLEEKKDWENIHPVVKRERWSKGIYFREGSLNVNLPYYQEYINNQIQISRKICKELILLVKRQKFFEIEDIDARKNVQTI